MKTPEIVIVMIFWKSSYLNKYMIQVNLNETFQVKLTLNRRNIPYQSSSTVNGAIISANNWTTWTTLQRHAVGRAPSKNVFNVVSQQGLQTAWIASTVKLWIVPCIRKKPQIIEFYKTNKGDVTRTFSIRSAAHIDANESLAGGLFSVFMVGLLVDIGVVETMKIIPLKAFYTF